MKSTCEEMAQGGGRGWQLITFEETGASPAAHSKTASSTSLPTPPEEDEGLSDDQTLSRQS